MSSARMPNAIIAGIFNFNVMPKFEAAAGAEKAPDLDIQENKFSQECRPVGAKALNM